MFGQQNTSPFGSPPAQTPFGAPQQQSNAFGSPAPAFGSNTGFGSTQTTFGQQQQQQQQPSGFAGFGAPTPAPATTGFGSFGATTQQSTSPFGAPAPAPGLFGSSAPAPSGGLFSGGTSTGGFAGTSTTQQSSGFGGGGGFGQQPSTAFGAPAPAFGAPASGSIFGASPPSSAFQAPTAPSLFGSSPAPAPGQSVFGGSPAAAPQSGGLFGQQAAAQGGVNGTSAVPFQPTTRQDGTSSITFQSITAMPQYEPSHYSFEELRFQDYSQGNRGTGSQQQQAGGFGSSFAQPAAPAPAQFGGFGGSPAAAPTGGLFGAPPAAPAPAFGGFGAPAAAPTGGLFGSTPAPAPSTGGFGFGQTPAPAPSNIFGGPPAPAPAQGGLFGSAPAPSTGLFGSAPAPGGGLFGSTQAPAPGTGGFGFGQAPAPAPGNLFGSPAPAPAQGGLFGSAPAPSTGLFGSAPAPAGGSLFGSTPAPAPSGFGFGAQPAPAPFGAPASGSLFGSPAPAAPGGLFSAPTQQTSLFGAPSAGQAPAVQPFGSPTAMIVPPAADAVLQQQLAAIENQRKELEQMEVWRGGSPQTSSVIPTSYPESQGLRVSPYSPPMASAVPYRASPRSTAKIRPRGFDTTPKLASSQKTPLPFMSPDGFVASTTKRLVIKSDTPKPSMRLRLRDVAAEETKEEIRDDVILRLPAVTRPAQANVASPPVMTETGVTSPPAQSAATPPGSTEMTESTPPTNGHGYDFYKKVIASAGSTPGSKKKSPETQESLVPKLTMPGYAVAPSLGELEAMSEADLATVSGFTVTRAGVGSVSWDGSVDVRGVDLDEVISIENRDVAVYDAAEANGTKPSVGNKLNRRAVITMYGVLPKEGSDAATIEKFERKIAKSTKNMDAELISYDSSSGVWKFRVPHFSRYALLDDTDEEDEDMEVGPESAKPTAQNFESGERGGRSRGEFGDNEEAPVNLDVGTSWFNAFVSEDEDMLDVTLVNDVENGGSEKNVIRAAENAYRMMSTKVATERVQKSKQKSILKKQKKREKQQEEANALFPDEGVAKDDMVAFDSVPIPPSEKELAISSRPGICARIAQKSGIQPFTASSTDYGMRMGRSFRVGWKPDGSFLYLQAGSAVVIKQSRPVFTDGTVGKVESARLLEVHLNNANRISSSLRECPAFCLAPADDGKLRKALSDYVAASTTQGKKDSDPEESLVLMRAFSLLLCLFTKENIDGSNAVDVPMIEAADEGKVQVTLTEQGRIDACIQWLTAACAEDVRNDIREALENNDVHSAIFAASTGGDIEQASAIAMNHGYLHLASLLATGAAGFDSISDQVQQWNESGAAVTIPAELLRIYTLLGGDLNSEGQVHLACIQAGTPASLDWRRRLCMLLTFGVYPNDEATLALLLERYGSELAENTVPYPSPRYIWNKHTVEESGPQSLLFKIIDLMRAIGGNAAETESLANVVAPSGYTAAISDFSGSFHVAAAISALGVGASLSPLEQAKLLDSYASQLVCNGRWDLAVYVLLCAFGIDRPEDLVARERIAKAIVLRNCPDVPEGGTILKRAELENIGVPSAWFEEALAYRCGNRGDTFIYVKHLSQFSPEQARTALEELVIPNILFMTAADVRTTLELISPFPWDDDTLARTVVDFFGLAEDVMAVSQSDDEERKSEEIPFLVDLAAFVKSRLLAHRSYFDEIQETSSSLRAIPSYRVVPTKTFLAEALAGVSFLQLQIGALAAGSSIWDDAFLRGASTRPLKVASELAFISARDTGVSSDASVDAEVTLAGLI